VQIHPFLVDARLTRLLIGDICAFIAHLALGGGLWVARLCSLLGHWVLLRIEVDLAPALGHTRRRQGPLLGSAPSEEAAMIRWQDDFEQAREQATKDGRPVFLFLFSPT
jgi:hypothetical protein